MTTVPFRAPCPPATCNCRRDELLAAPGADVRILRLTRHEEQRLLERLENIQSLADLEKLQQRMHEQLGIRLSIRPSHNDVRTMRCIAIDFAKQPVMCGKTRQSIPAAIRRGLEKQPEIAFRLLDAHDLLRDA